MRANSTLIMDENAIILRMRPNDTTPDAHRIQIEIYRRMSADDRLALALRVSEDLQSVTADGNAFATLNTMQTR